MAERFAELLARPPVEQLMALLNSEGAETRIVGGAVRNILLGLPASDIDMGTTLRPEAVMDRAAGAGLKAAPTGIEHGTVTVIASGVAFEVTTLRRDVETDGRRAVVAFSASFEEDALRRDFTINQFSLSLDGTVHDYAGGLNDLAGRKIRFIGEPEARIAEDYLRILRFFRFHAAYGEGMLDAAGLAACASLKGGLARLSAERIRAELLKLLAAPGAAQVMPVFVACGIWGEAVGGQPDLAAFSAAGRAFPDADPIARLAALAVRSEADAAALGRRLRLSSEEARRLAHTAKALEAIRAGHDRPERAVRLASIRFGAAAARDALGILATEIGPDGAAGLAALSVPAMPFRGNQVLARGVAAGPQVGEAIEGALELWATRGFPEDAALRDACLEDAIAPILSRSG